MHEISLNSDIVISGWKAAGIFDAVRNGAQNLPCIDPFFEIDNLITEKVNLGETFVNLDEEIRLLHINPRDDEDAEGESDWDDDEN